MPFYQRRGRLPSGPKHTTFYKEDGKSLYREELFSTRGFAGVYSTKYHVNMPTQVLSIEELGGSESDAWPEALHQPFHFFTDRNPLAGSYIDARTVFLRNEHVTIGAAYPSENTEDLFRNAHSHELFFVHRGRGALHSELGRLDFGEGDYLVVPKGTTYRLDFGPAPEQGNKLLFVQSRTPFEIPRHFRNDYGQILEHAPYCERDFRAPELLDPIDRPGEHRLVLETRDRRFAYTLRNHPFDVVGWDGFVYPFAFNIESYNPVVGRIHLPPPVHLVFTTERAVVCNFVPRPFDFHPQAIPAPYFHSNTDSDEVLYYVAGEFMSRKGIEPGSMTLHPMGLPHGPQPGKTEESIGARSTAEYAVMIDTFDSLFPTGQVKARMDSGYHRSWLD